MDPASDVIIYDHNERRIITEREQQKSSHIFSIGDPEPILGKVDDSLFETFFDESYGYYEPPVSFDGLTKAFRQNTCLESATFVRRNALASTFIPNQVLSRKTFEAVALDYENTGNAYLRKRVDIFNNLVRLEHINARSIRRGLNDRYCQLVENGFEFRPIWFKPDEIIHVMEYSPETSIYGMCGHLGCLHSAWLSEEATLFRRRFYRNGAHMGFIFYVEDDTLGATEEKELKKELAKTSGKGNFKPFLYVNRSKGKESKQMKLMQVGELITKDDFEKVKKISNQEILTAKRVPPQIMGYVPEQQSSLGDAEKAMKVFGYMEIKPMQLDFMDAINERLEKKYHIRFNDFEPLAAA